MFLNINRQFFIQKENGENLDCHTPVLFAASAGDRQRQEVPSKLFPPSICTISRCPWTVIRRKSRSILPSLPTRPSFPATSFCGTDMYCDKRIRIVRSPCGRRLLGVTQ